MQKRLGKCRDKAGNLMPGWVVVQRRPTCVIAFALGEAAEVFREAAGTQFVGATLPEDVGGLASGDLFIAFPTLNDFIPTSLWECLHNTGRHTTQLNPGFDMPQPPDCSCWRFRQAEFLLQARQLHQPEVERAAGDARTGR